MPKVYYTGGHKNRTKNVSPVLKTFYLDMKGEKVLVAMNNFKDTGLKFKVGDVITWEEGGHHYGANSISTGYPEHPASRYIEIAKITILDESEIKNTTIVETQDALNSEKPEKIGTDSLKTQIKQDTKLLKSKPDIIASTPTRKRDLSEELVDNTKKMANIIGAQYKYSRSMHKKHTYIAKNSPETAQKFNRDIKNLLAKESDEVIKKKGKVILFSMENNYRELVRMKQKTNTGLQLACHRNYLMSIGIK